MKRLTKNHPLDQKLRKLEMFMYELNISIEFDGYHLNVIDKENGDTAQYRDTESWDNLDEFPSIVEAALTIE